MGNILKKPSQKPDLIVEEKDEAETVFFDCQLCSNPISPTKKFINEKDCSHIFCKDCVAEYIGLRIESNAGEIPCPGKDCEVVLDQNSCKKIISNELYERWMDVLCYSSIVGLHKCYCPNMKCNVLIVNECGWDEKISKCPLCKKWYCFRCRVPWHDGRVCIHENDREKIDMNDMLFMEMIVGDKKNLVSCPNCHVYVELVPSLGFCIIRCRCRTMFCYHCGKKCTKLSCECDGYKKEMMKYQNKTTCKIFLVVIFIIIALVVWLIKQMKSDFYLD